MVYHFKPGHRLVEFPAVHLTHYFQQLPLSTIEYIKGQRRPATLTSRGYYTWELFLCGTPQTRQRSLKNLQCNSEGLWPAVDYLPKHFDSFGHVFSNLPRRARLVRGLGKIWDSVVRFYSIQSG